MAAIREIIISPGHNFFGRYQLPAGTHAAQSVASVQARAGWGLEGDRFYGYRPDYNGQVTFFAWETHLDAIREFAVPALSISAYRRNIVTEGIDLISLVNQRFSLGGIEYEGRGEARPCHWMNQAIAPGAETWLRGRGGLRARVVSDGVVAVGPVDLILRGERQGQLAFGS